jgi:exodeoxyribonuclease-5
LAEALTTAQRQALEAFSAWLTAKPDGRPFVLSGYAGTGKTFLSMALLALAEQQDLCWTVVAPTHKAVGVLRAHLQAAGLHPTWFPSTIHRLLRLRLRRQGEVERCEETEQTATALEHLGLVLVDEASMLDAQLLEITLRCAHSFRTRLVFVGDPAQLPPVAERESPVFRLGRAISASLTEVVRHQGPVLRLAQGIREHALPCQPPPPFAAVFDPAGGGARVEALERRAWLAAAQAALRQCAESGDPDRVRLLCYTNRSLERLVPIARRALHGAMADQLPVLPGEVLISRTAVMAPACAAGEEAAEEPDMVMASNREVLVHDVQPERCDLADFGLTMADLLSDDGLALPLPVPVIETLIASVEAGPHQLRLRLLPPAGSAARQSLEAVLQRLRQSARLLAQREGKAAARPLWRRFFLVRDAFASLGPAAVLTVHRSQGSTFGQVFIDNDVFWPPDPLLRRQLVYVAVSRASQAVTLMAGPGSATMEGVGGQPWRRWLQADGP